MGGAGASTGEPWLERSCPPLHPSHATLCTSLRGPLLRPLLLSSPAWCHTYIESLFPQGRRVRRALVVGGEPLVHCGGLVDSAGC